MASGHHKKIHQTQANLQSGKPCFPKGAQFGTANDESLGFAELLLARTKNLNYFRPDFSHLLPGRVWQGPVEGIFMGWTGEEQLPVPATAGMLHSCFPIW